MTGFFLGIRNRYYGAVCSCVSPVHHQHHYQEFQNQEILFVLIYLCINMPNPSLYVSCNCTLSASLQHNLSLLLYGHAKRGPRRGLTEKQETTGAVFSRTGRGRTRRSEDRILGKQSEKPSINHRDD